MSALVSSESTYAAAEVDDADVDVETRLSALSLWWSKHSRSFSLWYLALNREQQKEVIAKTEVFSTQLPAGNWLLPEFDEQSDFLLDRSLCILMTSRRASADLSLSDDLKMLESVRTAGHLPDLSSGQFSQLRCPFVDLFDPTQRYNTKINCDMLTTLITRLKAIWILNSIQALSLNSSQEVVDQVDSWLGSGRLVRAEVWLVLQLRRAALCTFFEALTKLHQLSMPAEAKPSPTYMALLRAEKQMRSQTT